MKTKIILPYFTEINYKANKINPVIFLAHLKKSNGKYLILTSALINDEFSYSLFQFSNEFIFEKEILVNKLFDEIKNVFSELQFSMIELPSNQIMISTTLNRCFIINEDGSIDPKSYNSTISKKGEWNNLVEQQTNDEKIKIASENLFLKAKYIPDSNEIIALIDGNISEGVNERRKRGDFIVKSENGFMNQYNRFNLISSLDKSPNTFKPQSFSYIFKNNNTFISDGDLFEDCINNKLKSDGKSYYGIWCNDIYPIKNDLTVISVFESSLRSGGKGSEFSFLFINDNGDIINYLKGIDCKKYSLGKLDEYNLVISQKEEIIYFKVESDLFIFDFNGNCVEKIELQNDIKALSEFTLIEILNNGNLLFWNKKKFNFLILPRIKLKQNNIEIITEALHIYKTSK